MTIVQLEYLIAVVNTGSFSLASEQCFVTQPSLSMQIKNLEQELGVVLLDRSKKPVLPTEVGAIIVANAKDAIKSFNNVKEAIREHNGEVAGNIRLGVIPTIAPFLLPRLIPEFTQRYPKVHLEVHEMLTSDIFDAMRCDIIDVALISGGNPPKGIGQQELFRDRFFAYISHKNYLYNRHNIKVEDVQIKDLLLLSEGNCLRDQIQELCQINRKNYMAYSFEGSSIETLIRMVDATSKVTIIPEMAVPYVRNQQQHNIKMLNRGTSSRKIYLAVRRTYVKTSIVAALQETILDMESRFHVKIR